MTQVTVLYWRDIPAQVIARQGRVTAKRKLDERFEQAIDRCAMRVGARDSDAYLAEWRRGAAQARDGDPETAAAAESAALERRWDAAALDALVRAGGWEAPAT